MCHRRRSCWCYYFISAARNSYENPLNFIKQTQRTTYVGSRISIAFSGSFPASVAGREFAEVFVVVLENESERNQWTQNLIVWKQSWLLDYSSILSRHLNKIGKCVRNSRRKFGFVYQKNKMKTALGLSNIKWNFTVCATQWRPPIQLNRDLQLSSDKKKLNDKVSLRFTRKRAFGICAVYLEYVLNHFSFALNWIDWKYKWDVLQQKYRKWLLPRHKPCCSHFPWNSYVNFRVIESLDK